MDYSARRRAGGRRRGGFTLIELVIATPIVLIAASMVASTLLASTRQKVLNRENAVVGEAVRSVFERMRNEQFLQVFALYNAEAFDDPMGPGTAPGNRFTIEGLEPLPGALGGTIGEVVFPAINTGGAIDTDWELREDVVSEELGMPRDLNGDQVVDDLDHAEDYRLVPIVIVARWQSIMGPREFRMQTLMAEWNGLR